MVTGLRVSPQPPPPRPSPGAYMERVLAGVGLWCATRLRAFAALSAGGDATAGLGTGALQLEWGGSLHCWSGRRFCRSPGEANQGPFYCGPNGAQRDHLESTAPWPQLPLPACSTAFLRLSPQGQPFRAQPARAALQSRGHGSSLSAPVRNRTCPVAHKAPLLLSTTLGLPWRCLRGL